jgi:hypothetical protein
MNLSPNHLEGSLTRPARLPKKRVTHLDEVLASRSDFLIGLLGMMEEMENDSCFCTDQS